MIVASYIDYNTCTTSGDLTSIFHTGRRVRATCSGSYKFGTISSSSYSDPNTTINMTEASDDLNEGLTEIYFGIVSNTSTGSLPTHTHQGSEGDGGILSEASISDLDKYTQSEVDNLIATTSGTLQGEIDGLTIDHGELTGLNDNDHPQYLLTTDFSTYSGTLQSQITSNDDEMTILNTKIDTTSGTLQGEIDINAGNISNNDTDISNLQSEDLTFVKTDGSRNFTGQETFESDVVIQGNLVVSGTQFITETETVKIEDNLLLINYGEVGAGVTLGQAGIEVDRGSETNYQFLYDEAQDNFRIGISGSLQAVATREDSPVDTYLAYWNAAQYRFDTVSGIAYTDVVGLTNEQTLTNKTLTSPIINTILTADGKTGAVFTEDGASSLYFAGNKSIETTIDGGANGGLAVYSNGGSGMCTLSVVGGTYLDSRTNSHTVNIRGRNLSGTTVTLFVGDPVGTAELYWAGAKRLETDGDGINIYYGSEYFGLFSDGTDWIVKSYSDGANVKIQGNNSAGTPKVIFSGDPDGTAELYHAGVKTFQTDSLGFKYGPAATDGYFFLSGGTNYWQLQNAGSALIIRGRDVGNTTYNTMFSADPDGASELYYAGVKSAETGSGSIKVFSTTADSNLSFVVTDSYSFIQNSGLTLPLSILVSQASAGDQAALRAYPNNRVELYYAGNLSFQTYTNGLRIYNGSKYGYFYYSGTDSGLGLVIENTEHGGNVNINSENTAGDAVVLFAGDPDGAAELYYAGVKSAETGSGSIRVFSPTADSSLNFVVTDSYTNIQNNGLTLPLSIIVSQESSGDRAALRAYPNSRVELYYAGSKVVETRISGSEYGIRITDGDSQTGDLIKHASGAFIMFNREDGGLIVLQADNAASATKVILQGNPDGAAELYYAGVKTFETAPGQINVYDVDASDSGYAWHTGTHFTIGNNSVSGHVLIYGEDLGGNTTLLFKGDPDGPAELYYAGSKSIYTQANGPIVCDGETDYFQLNYNTGFFGLYGYENGAYFRVRAEDNSGTAQEIIQGDPDGSVSLYHAGVKTCATATAGGIRTYSNDQGEGAQFYTANDGTTTIQTLSETSYFQVYLYADPAIRCNSGGAVSLYYDGIRSVTTLAGGLQHYNDGNAYPLSVVQTSTGAFILNSQPGYGIRLTSRNVGDTANNYLFNADPDGAAELYNAGVKRLGTTSEGNGILVYSDAGRLVGSMGVYGIYHYYDDANNYQIRMYTASNGDGVIQTQTGLGKAIYLASRNAGDTAYNKMFYGIPDGAAELYYNGIKEAETIDNGLKATNSFNIAGTSTVTSILDEDDMDADSQYALATQQSIKAYVDNNSGVESGTKMYFYQNTAPTGWTIDATVSDVLLAIKGGSNAYNTSGGATAGTWTQPNHTHTGPSHNHTIAHSHNLVNVNVFNGSKKITSGEATFLQVDTTNGFVKSYNIGAGSDTAGRLDETTGASSAANSGDSGTAATGNGATAATYRPNAAIGIIATKD